MQFRKLTQIEELETEAKDKLSQSTYDFIAGGAGSEWSIANNREAFYKHAIIPRVMQDVSSIDTSLEIFGRKISNPVLIAPCAFHKLVCADGEIATAKAAEIAETIMTLSTMSSCTIEEVAKASTGPKWFQLYVFKDRSITESLIKRAEQAGYDALVVTVDVPAMGIRLRDIKNHFTLPSHIDAANFREEKLSSLSDSVDGSKIKEHTDKQFDASLTWQSIDWISSITKLPIILKGILNPEDAAEALKHKASAIIVSNHGGRQLDSAVSSMDVLPDIVEVIKNKIPIFVDGGLRSGEDIFKALAIGASAVMIGRPVLWSLAIGGSDHLVSTFQKFNQELTLTMRLTGCSSLKAIREKGFTLLSNPDLERRKILQILEKELRHSSKVDVHAKLHPSRIFSRL